MRQIKDISAALENASPEAVTAITTELRHLRARENSRQRLQGWAEVRLWVAMLFNFGLVVGLLFMASHALSRQDEKTTAAIWGVLGFALRSAIAGIQSIGTARKERTAKPKSDDADASE